jgi:glutamate 5-kinase
VILSDIDGLYDKNPQKYDDAKFIHVVESIDEKIIASAGGAGSSVGTGGMITKLKAAEIVTAYGGNMIIARGTEENVLNRLVKGEVLGTIFLKNKKALNAKKQWIGYGANFEGEIVIDEGAKNAILNNKSLLPVGIKSIVGDFKRGSIVRLVDKDRNIIAKGISNYKSEDLKKIVGVQSNKIESILGFNTYNEAIHVNNITIKES